MGKQLVFILFFFLNLLIHNAYAYNLKQVADKEYMSNSSITSLCQDERLSLIHISEPTRP